MADRRLLLAGSVGPERVPARPSPDDADWYLPLHLRNGVAARARLAGQISAGADVIVAPTWLTHRRALLPLGETRRVGAWSNAAVRFAREAVDVGLERREEAQAEAPEGDPGHGRPQPLVAATLPALDDEPEAATGRLLPREAATERDYRDQAGALADAEPDLLLVEGQRDEEAARVAIAEAVQTGLPVWAALTTEALATTDLEGWLDWAQAAGVARLLLPPPLAERHAAAEGDLPWGGLVPTADDIADWLEAGAGVMALLDGATRSALDAGRAAIDDFERAGIEAALSSEQRWLDHLRRAAAMAPGGAAAWIGSTPHTPLPDGFDWIVISAEEVRQLPQGHYRLVVAAEAVEADLGRLLERGGIIASRMPLDHGEVVLRVLNVDASAEPALALYRREA